PPAGAGCGDWVGHGSVRARRERGVGADTVRAEITHALVLRQRAPAALREAGVVPALARGYRQVWLAGISLGAFTALHYAAQFDADVAGLCLLAPYPGTGDILREIAAAGGLAHWAGSHERSLNDERAWWYWLWQQTQAGADAKPIHVGLSENDRFLQGQRLLAGLLPREHVDTIPGT